MKTLITLFLLLITLSACNKEYFVQDPQSNIDDAGYRSTSGIQRDLLWLSSSLCLAHDQLWDTLPGGEVINPVSEIILRNARWGISDYYAISYDDLLNEAESQGIELDEIMNTIIRDVYDVTTSSNIVREILNNNYHNSVYYKFHIVIPFLDELAGVNHNSNTQSITISDTKIHTMACEKPYFSFIHQNFDDFPIDGFHADLGDLTPAEITHTLALSDQVFISVFDYISNNLYQNFLSTDYVLIDDCYLLKRNCQECPYENTNEPLEFITGGAGVGDHELQINLNQMLCYEVHTDVPGGVEEAYAVLKSLPLDCYYYGITDGAENKSAYRVELPLHSFITARDGNYLTLCDAESIFKIWGELPGYADYALASGGVYSLSLPGISADPIYFSYPFGPQIWFQNGPDLEIDYELEIDGATMCGLNDDFFDAVSNESTYHINEFYTNNIVDPLNNRYIASTDLNEILGYWTDNWVHLGFATSGYAMVTPNNFHSFEASEPTTPAIPGDLGLEIGHLSKSVVAGVPYYQIEETFVDEVTYSGGEDLIIYIHATFENGEEIDEYRYVTLDMLPFGAEVAEIHTFFRGKINEYDVKVYTRL